MKGHMRPWGQELRWSRDLDKKEVHGGWLMAQLVASCGDWSD